MIWKTSLTIEELNRRVRNTLVDLLDISFTKLTPNALIAIMPVHQKHMQPIGIMHGGASCVLAESVGSMAANLCVDVREHHCVGLDININHLRQVRSGMVLTATATPLHIGKTTHVWDIKIHNDEEKLIAISRLTVAVLKQGKA